MFDFLTEVHQIEGWRILVGSGISMVIGIALLTLVKTFKICLEKKK